MMPMPNPALTRPLVLASPSLQILILISLYRRHELDSCISDPRHHSKHAVAHMIFGAQRAAELSQTPDQVELNSLVS